MRDLSSKLPRGVRRLFRLPLTAGRVLREVDDEIGFHFEMRVAELRALGMSEADARLETARRFGDSEEYRAYVRRQTASKLRWYSPTKWGEHMHRTVSDGRLALRSLRRSAMFSVTVILVLALGIGMTTAMFTVFQSVLLRELPIREQGRVVELSGLARGAATEVPIIPAQLRRFRGESRMLSGVAAFGHWRVLNVAFSEGDRTISLRESEVTDNFFDVLGTRPLLGHLFHAGDAPDVDWAAPKRTYPVVLSYGSWRRAFGGDSAALGRHLHEPKTDMDMVIVGVAPPGLDYPRGVECWLAYTYGSLDVVGRLTRGATVASARDEFLGFLHRDPDAIGLGAHELLAQVHTLQDTVLGDARPVLFILAAAVGLLMLVACTNVGNLMLLRAVGRMREMAIRRAIGASVVDLVRQLLVECVLLAVAAGCLGVFCAELFVRALVRLAPAGVPRLDLLSVAGLPLAIAGAVTALTVIVFGLVPSFGALRFDLASPLRGSGRSGMASRHGLKLRASLVAAQVGLAIVIAAGAGLLLRSLQKLTTLDTGYSSAHLAFVSVSFPWTKMIRECRPHLATLTTADTARWTHCEEEANYNAHDRVMDQLRSLPGVVSVSPSVAPPFLGSNVWMTKAVPEHQSTAEAKTNPWFGLDLVGADFFRTLEMPIVRGRGFTDADREGAPKVAVISEGVAKAMWPDQDALGKRFHEPNADGPDSLITIVGIVPDLHFREYRQPTPTVFRPYRQVYAQGYFVVRTRGAPEQLFAAVRTAMTNAGVGATFVNAQSMDQLIAPQLAAPRFQSLLLSVFAASALVLAAIGLYGVTASAVNQQTRELGIRIALGATPRNLRRMVLGRAVTLAGAGAGAGLLVAAGSARLLQSMLFEISPLDPLTLLAVTALLFAVAVLAAYVPARRATLIDPARALRAE